MCVEKGIAESKRILSPTAPSCMFSIFLLVSQEESLVLAVLLVTRAVQSRNHRALNSIHF